MSDKQTKSDMEQSFTHKRLDPKTKPPNKRSPEDDTKPDLHCVIEELSDLRVLPFGWVLLRREDEENPDLINIKYLGGLDPLARITELEDENKSYSRSLDMAWAVLLKRKPFIGGYISSAIESLLSSLEAQVAKQAQTIKGGHERQAQLATKLHDTEIQTLRLWGACLEYLKAPPANVPARKKFANLVTGGKTMPDAAREWLEKAEKNIKKNVPVDYRPVTGHIRHLLAEVEDVKHVLDMVGIEHSGHRSQGDRVRMLADDRDRAMGLARRKAKRANELEAHMVELKLELIKERLKWLSDALRWDEITKKQHDEQTKQLRIMRSALDA